MEFLDNIKKSILNFKLNLCCFVARLRLGLLIFGYYNLIWSVISLIAVAIGSFPPLYMHAQQTFMEGEYVKSSATLACCADLCSSVLLLSGIYRRCASFLTMFPFTEMLEKDIILLKYYTYVGLAMAAATLLVYGMVLGVLDMLTTLQVIINLTYQIYLILLVRSFIVELKMAATKNGNVSLRLNDVEADVENKEKYSVVIEPEIPTKTPRNVALSEDIPKYVTVVKDLPKSETSELNKEDIAKPDASEGSKGTAYPFKFVAIKIPKETAISEEKAVEVVIKDGAGKENTEKTEEVEGDANKQESKDEEIVRNIIKPPKRSIFGRRKGRIVDSKANDEESKKH